MATFSDTVIDGSMATDAEFRAEATFIHNIFSGGAFVQTSDTGQINLTTVTKPGAANTSAGYEIWRFDDALQSTKPVFLKIEYGTSSSSAAVFAIWFTIGTGSDGAGTITGSFKARTQCGQGSANVGAGNSFGSAAGGSRICFCMLSNLSQFYWFSLERTKDNTGADTNVGLILGYSTTSSAARTQYLPYPPATVPSEELGIHVVLSTINPSTFGGDTGIGVAIPIMGVAQQPGMNICVVQNGDFAAGASFSFTIYGATHTYQIMSSVSSVRATTSGGSDTSVRLALRYD